MSHLVDLAAYSKQVWHPMLLVDGHLDLSMNALEWNRDLTRPLAEIRRRETGQSDKKDRGRNVCTL